MGGIFLYLFSGSEGYWEDEKNPFINMWQRGW